MVPGILGLLVVAVAAAGLAAPHVSRRLSRVRQAPGAAVVPPVRSQPSGGMAVPAEVPPSSVMTGPFAYDDGVLTGRPAGEDTS